MYRVCLSLVPTPYPVIVRASIHRNGEQVVSATDTVNSKDGHLTTLLMQVNLSTFLFFLSKETSLINFAVKKKFSVYKKIFSLKRRKGVSQLALFFEYAA